MLLSSAPYAARAAEGVAAAGPGEPDGGCATTGAMPARAEGAESPIELSDAEGDGAATAPRGATGDAAIRASDAAGDGRGGEAPHRDEGAASGASSRAFATGDVVRLNPAVAGDRIMDPSGWYLNDDEEAIVSRTDRSMVFLIDPRGSVSASAINADKLVLVRAGAWAPQRRRDRERDDRSRGRGPGSHKQEPECYKEAAVDFRKVRESISAQASPRGAQVELPEAARGRGGHRTRPDANARSDRHRSPVTAGAVWRDEGFRVDADDTVSVRLWVRRGERVGFNVITDPALTHGSRCVVNSVSGNLERISGDRCVGLELVKVNEMWLRTRSESATELMNRHLRGVHGPVRLQFRPFHEPPPRQAPPRGGGPKESTNRPSQQVIVQHARMDPGLRRRAFAPAVANP
eukprot:gene19438-biopygen23000